MNEIKEIIRKAKMYLMLHWKTLMYIEIGILLFSAFLSSVIQQTGENLVHRRYSPLYIYYYGVHKGTLVFVALFLFLSGVILYRKIFIDVRDKKMDEEMGIEILQGDDSYGSAGKMDEAEMRECFDLTTFEKTNKQIYGRLDKTHCYVLTDKTQEMLGPHQLVAGCTRSGKTATQFMPAFFQCIKRGESIVCTDPKGELRKLTKQLARKYGYETYEFNTIMPILSDSINFMKLVSSFDDARVFTDIIMNNTEGDGNHHEDFWAKAERALICFGILYVMEAKDIKEEDKTFYKVYEILTQTDEGTLVDKVNALPDNSYAKSQYRLFERNGEGTQGGIITGVGTRLQFLNDPAIRYITGHDEINIEDIGRKPTILYMIASDMSSANNVLNSIFYSFLFIKLAALADRRYNQRLKVPVNIYLDEFPNTVKIPEFPKKLSTIASRGMKCMICVQDIGQMETMYPGKQFANILGNCGVKMCIGTNDTFTAQYFSDLSGQMTIGVETEREAAHHFLPYLFRGEYQKSKGAGKRPVYFPDEVLRMEPEKMLISLRGHNIKKVDKYPYYEMPMYDEIEKELYLEHEPKWWDKIKNSNSKDEDFDWWYEQYDYLQQNIEEMKAEEEEEERKKLSENTIAPLPKTVADRIKQKGMEDAVTVVKAVLQTIFELLQEKLEKQGPFNKKEDESKSKVRATGEKKEPRQEAKKQEEASESHNSNVDHADITDNTVNTCVFDEDDIPDSAFDEFDEEEPQVFSDQLDEDDEDDEEIFFGGNDSSFYDEEEEEDTEEKMSSFMEMGTLKDAGIKKQEVSSGKKEEKPRLKDTSTLEGSMKKPTAPSQPSHQAPAENTTAGQVDTSKMTPEEKREWAKKNRERQTNEREKMRRNAYRSSNTKGL